MTGSCVCRETSRSGRAEVVGEGEADGVGEGRWQGEGGEGKAGAGGGGVGGRWRRRWAKEEDGRQHRLRTRRRSCMWRPGRSSSFWTAATVEGLEVIDEGEGDA